MSMTLASADLCVTQSAVSREIHALEEMLGVRLLMRGHRAISFTAEGERLFRAADPAVRQLQEIVGARSRVLAGPGRPRAEGGRAGRRGVDPVRG